MDEKRELTIDDKKKLNSERQKAVREAWRIEKEHVALGEGTRDWTPEQQQEMMENGKVEGFEGHHMKSVSNYPEHAGNPENIQLLSEKEHFEGAHQGNFRNLTNGYYNPGSGAMEEFNGNELRPVPCQELSDPCYQNGELIEGCNEQSATAFNASVVNTGHTSTGDANSFNDSVKYSNSAETGQNTSDNKQSNAISR